MSYANANLTEMTSAISCKLTQLPYAKVRKGLGIPAKIMLTSAWDLAELC